MIRELPVQYLPEHAARFAGAQAAMVTASIAEGNTAGQLWTAGAGDALLLWDKGNNVFYLAGEHPTDDAIRALAAFIGGEIRSRALNERLAHFHVCALSDAGARAAPRLFSGIVLEPVSKRFYECTRVPAAAAPQLALPGARCVPIDAALLEHGALHDAEHARAEIEWMWPSLARFYEHGFGVAAVLGAAVIGWCTAEYVSREHCGIGIETVEHFRGRGVATALAAQFIARALARGLTPHWECSARNLGSVRVAEKAGFRLQAETTFWVGRFDQG